MKTKSAKAKGRRLQDRVAKILCDTLDLELNKDIRVRIMGEAGSDIEILSDRAENLICTYNDNPIPLHIECKNIESWNFDSKTFWENSQLPSALARAIKQSYNTGTSPAIVFSKNRGPTLVLFRLSDFGIIPESQHLCVCDFNNYIIMNFKNFVEEFLDA